MSSDEMSNLPFERQLDIAERVGAMKKLMGEELKASFWRLVACGFCTPLTVLGSSRRRSRIPSPQIMSYAFLSVRSASLWRQLVVPTLFFTPPFV